MEIISRVVEFEYLSFCVVKEGLANSIIGVERAGYEILVEIDYNGVGKLQYLMGHSEIETTLDVYTHFGYEEAKKEVGKVSGR